MLTAVDTSVLLDVLLNDPLRASTSVSALHQAAAQGSLVISETALAEIVPVLPPGECVQFLADWNLRFLPTTQPVAILAGEMYRTFLERGGKRGRMVPSHLPPEFAAQLRSFLGQNEMDFLCDPKGTFAYVGSLQPELIFISHS